jgi:hypothetical protein
MLRIVPLVASLQEHLDRLSEKPEDYRPAGCPQCGLARPWHHGHYDRKADRGSGRLNPVPVPRYVCGRKGGCQATCSTVPSCLPPRRWYLWNVQGAVLLALLSGISLRRCADTFGCILGPSRRTVRRWWRWLQARHDLFSFHLRHHEPEWGGAVHWTQFWCRALAQQPLRELMAYLDRERLIVP